MDNYKIKAPDRGHQYGQEYMREAHYGRFRAQYC